MTRDSGDTVNKNELSGTRYNSLKYGCESKTALTTELELGA